MVIRIGIDYYVRTQAQARIEASHECARKPLVACVSNDVIDAPVFCNARSVVTAAVVDDEPFDLVESSYLARQRVEGDGNCLGLVKTRNLDNELQSRG